MNAMLLFRNFQSFQRKVNLFFCQHSKNFCPDTDWTNFIFIAIEVSENDPALSRILIFDFILGHGQASVERVFSLNDIMLIKYTMELFLVSHLNITDFMASSNLQAHKVEISMEVINCSKHLVKI